MFWVTFFIYCILFAITLVASVFLVGFFDIWAKWGTGLELSAGVVTLFILSIVLLITGLWVIDVIAKTAVASYSKYTYNSYDREPSQLSKGIYNWYSQVKDKFCPIVTKEKGD